MKRLLCLLIACLALGAVAAGCGSDDNSSDTGGGSATATQQDTTQAQTDSGGTAAGGKTVEVKMKDIQFDPKAVTVPAGGTVKWTNEDSANHDVTKTAGPGAQFSSGTGNLAKGDTYEETFKQAGEIKYVCTVHPGMEGTITVK